MLLPRKKNEDPLAGDGESAVPYAGTANRRGRVAALFRLGNYGSIWNAKLTSNRHADDRGPD
jgi:hypothetical protein